MADLFDVSLTPAALADLADIGDHIAELRGLDEAEALIDRLRALTTGLARSPLRGPVPKEIAESGRTDIRQTMLGRFRIFYKVDGSEVSVFMFADGRRDIDALLELRL